MKKTNTTLSEQFQNGKTRQIRYPNIQIQDRLLSWLGTGISTKSGGVLSGVRVTRSLVLCIRLVDRCLSFVYPRSTRVGGK